MIPEISEKQFHQQLAEAISDLIAKRLNIYPKQAVLLFVKQTAFIFYQTIVSLSRTFLICFFVLLKLFLLLPDDI